MPLICKTHVFCLPRPLRCHYVLNSNLYSSFRFGFHFNCGHNPTTRHFLLPVDADVPASTARSRACARATGTSGLRVFVAHPPSFVYAARHFLLRKSCDIWSHGCAVNTGSCAECTALTRKWRNARIIPAVRQTGRLTTVQVLYRFTLKKTSVFIMSYSGSVFK